MGWRERKFNRERRGLRVRSLAIFAVAGLSLVLIAAHSSGHANKHPADSAQHVRDRAKFPLQPCSLPRLESGALCGNFEVDENRSTKTGRKIALNIVVLPAKSDKPAPDPVFWIDGGPGAPATWMASLRGVLDGVWQDRDLIFVDQRGTGKSNPLNCDFDENPADLSSFVGARPLNELALKCREKLEKVADLRLYTTPIAMDDLDDVRAALGYDRINLAGESYGSLAAQVYMRQHPGHLRAVFLVGVATPDIKQPLLFPRASQHALDAVAAACSAEDACRQAFPNFRQEFDAVLARFEKGPLKLELIDPTSHEKKQVDVWRDRYVETMRLLLYNTGVQRFLPLIVHRAFLNNFVTFEEAAILLNPGDGIARGMYMTVTCSEGVPFITEQDILRETRGTFLGDSRLRSHIAACSAWPRGEVGANFIELVKSDVPVLMISGEADGATLPSFGEAALKYLPHGRQVRIQEYGHQSNGPCVAQMFREFIEKGAAKGIDVSCAATIRRPAFATEVPKQFDILSGPADPSHN